MPDFVLQPRRLCSGTSRTDVHVVPGADGFLLFLNFGFVEIGDFALDGLDGVDLIHRLHMEVDEDAALHIQKVRQHPVIQLRCQNLHEADRAQLFAHAEHPAGLELKGAGRDKVLGGQPGWSQPVPRKAERLLLVHPQNVVHDVQALEAVQRRSHNAQPLEVVQEVGFDALQTGLCRAEVVGLNAEREILGLNEAVVAAGKLILQHTGVLGADAVKLVPAGRNGNAPCKGFLRSREVHKGKLELHGAVKVVQEIAPRLKDGGLVLVL